MSRSVKSLFPFLFASLILFAITRINYSFWPPVWPDEALFSSPAAQLAETGIFSTPVLEGLIPGMEKATLWNSPFYMALTSLVYRFTGESLAAARSVSLVLGFLSAGVFVLLISLFLEKKFILPAVLFLVFDPAFHRSANTARMDMLTLFWILCSLYFLVREFQGRVREQSKTSLLWFFLSGLSAGLAVMSHPAGILLIPILLIFSLPRLYLLIPAAAGWLIGITPWISYINRYPDLFKIQFVSQLVRKTDLFRLWGGDTGGIFVVFASQYGGGALSMIGIAIVILALGFASALFLYRRRSAWETDLYFRLFAAFCTTFVLVLAATEGWYALYIGPFVILLAGYLASSSSSPFFRRLFLAVGLFFVLAFVVFTLRNHLIFKTDRAVTAYNASMIQTVRGCHRVYLRVRPDPYFLIRRDLPDTRPFEFVPGKLQVSQESGKFSLAAWFFDRIIPGETQLPDRKESLLAAYRSFDCFLLDDHGDWEPSLTDFLEKNRKNYSTVRIEAARPLESSTLWKLRRIGPVRHP